MELEGKNALITGAAKRLGRASALALADKGVNIAVHYHRSEDAAEELVGIIEGKGLKSIAIKADLERPEEISKTVQKAHDFFGSLDILINNAAIFYPTPIGEVTGEDWDKFLNINLKSQFFFSKEFAALKHGGIAKIINMADSYGASPAAKFIPYGVSKAGVIAMTKGLAKEFAPEILVNCICPGPILPAVCHCEDDERSEEDKAISRSQLRATNSTLLKREGTVEDITKTVVYLAENDYITGQAIFVDGGGSVHNS